MGGERIQRDADDVVEDYIKKRWIDANARLVKEKLGKGCGCRNCVNRAVKDANEWTDMAAGGSSRNPIKHFVDWTKGKPKIKTEPNPEFGQEDE